MIIRARFRVGGTEGVERVRTAYYPSFGLYSSIDADHAPSMTHAALLALTAADSPAGALWATQWACAGDGTPFLWEVRIQPSKAARYQDEYVQAQGFDVRRVEFLRRTGAPVLIAFGMNEFAENFDQAWLHDLPDTPLLLDSDPTAPRRGWAVNREPWKHGPLLIPETVPQPLPREQESLI